MGTLYIVATPIGNLEDITFRAVRILREVSLIAAEDTRTARHLLDHYGITTPLTSFFEGNEERKLDALLRALDAGDVALISEAGMPGISDPGYTLIRAALEHGVPLVAVPGPSAHTAALVVSGLPTDRFLFLGFLPRAAGEKRAALEAIADVRATLILYEAPHRLHETLQALHDVLGPRRVALCRELTKLYEEVWRGTLTEALTYVEDKTPRGEYTLVVEGAPQESARWDEPRVRAALQALLAQGVPPSQAARDVAAQSGWRRRDVYALLVTPSSIG